MILFSTYQSQVVLSNAIIVHLENKVFVSTENGQIYRLRHALREQSTLVAQYELEHPPSSIVCLDISFTGPMSLSHCTKAFRPMRQPLLLWEAGSRADRLRQDMGCERGAAELGVYLVPVIGPGFDKQRMGT